MCSVVLAPATSACAAATVAASEAVGLRPNPKPGLPPKSRTYTEPTQLTRRQMTKEEISRSASPGAIVLDLSGLFSQMLMHTYA